MSTHRLAQGTVKGVDVDCRVLLMYVDDYGNDVTDNNYAYYSDFCLNFDSDVDWTDWEYTNSDDWCDTWRGASYWISFIVFGCLMTCLATCWVQPLCVMDRCCCPRTCPRVFYIFGLILCILGNVLWTTNDKVCLSSDAFDLDIGTSIDLVAGGCVIIFVVMFCAK